jgi:DNA invertase Pin-like site-specific DNA recombinase
MVLIFQAPQGKRRERKPTGCRLRNREFGQCKAKPRAGQTPACPIHQGTYPAVGAGLERLFKKARQLVEKLIKKLFSYSKNATKTVRASHISVQWVKKRVNCSVYYVKKHSTCRKNIRARQTFDSEGKTP